MPPPSLLVEDQKVRVPQMRVRRRELQADGGRGAWMLSPVTGCWSRTQRAWGGSQARTATEEAAPALRGNKHEL